MKFNGKSIKNMTYDEIINMLKINGSLIRCIKNPTFEMIQISINQNPFSIKYIKDPSEYIQIMAVRINPHSIRSIIEPTVKVQYEAVSACSADKVESLIDEIYPLDDNIFKLIKKKTKKK